MAELRLTDEQQVLVEIDEGPVLVTAPPGSGKTEVLVQRIVRLLEQSAGQSFRVLALTFTTKAAESLAGRVRQRVEADSWRAWISTIHSFCLEVLRHYGEPVGVDPDVSVYETDEDRIQVLAEAVAESGYELGDADASLMKDLLARIDRLRRDLVPVAEVGNEEFEGISVATAYESYDAMLRQYAAVDFDGILLLTYRLFTEYPRVAAHYRRIYRYILLDEAQDTNRAQYGILTALCGDDHRNLFVVADANQSMYAFAGASDQYVRQLALDFGAAEYTLGNNFRSAQAIVKIANSLLSKSPRKRAKADSMRAAGDAPGWVGARSYQTEEAEARAVVEWVAGLLDRGLDPSWLLDVEQETRRHIAAEDVCVLGRSRYSLSHVLREFEAQDIEHQFRVGEREFFDSDPFRAFLYALRLLSNARDQPARRNLVDLLSRRGAVTLIDGDTGRAVPVEEIAAGFKSVGELRMVAEALLLSGAGVDELVGLGLSMDVEAIGAGEQSVPLMIEDQGVLRARWSEYAARVGRDSRSLPGFLAHLSIARRVTLDGPGVRVLTVHSAKGLEFPAVAVVGLNEGVFPDFRNLGSDSALDDERRNAYVAVTRAERALLLTRSRTRRTSYGNRREQEPSRFLAEMGVQLLSV